MQLTPARVSALLAGAATLCAALAPAVANLDTTSTAGAIAGIVGLVGVLETFLKGQRAHEARIAVPAPSAISQAALLKRNYELAQGSQLYSGSVSGVQPIMAGTMGPSGPGMTDDGEDGDDQLPAELVDHPVTEDPPEDEINLPHGEVTP